MDLPAFAGGFGGFLAAAAALAALEASAGGFGFFPAAFQWLWRLLQARNIPIWSGCVGMLFLAVVIILHHWAVGMLGMLSKVASLQPCNLTTK